jgi:hypothetical protein
MPTILCQGNGILNVGDETRIYHGRWRNAGQKAEDVTAHYRAEVALATLPRDRWGGIALEPAARTGAICSAALPLPRAPFAIRLNADGCRGMKVELLDERFQPLAGFSGDDAGRVAADGGLDCPVAWPRGDLARRAGRPARIHLSLDRGADGAGDAAAPRLYAVTLVAAPDDRR